MSKAPTDLEGLKADNARLREKCREVIAERERFRKALEHYAQGDGGEVAIRVLEGGVV